LEIVQRRGSLDEFMAEGVDRKQGKEEDVGHAWQASLVRTLDALDNGVSLARRQSTEDNVKLQGDVTMIGATKFKARMRLKESVALQTVLENWWDQLDLNGNDKLDKEHYTEINIALHHLVHPGISDAEALSTAHADFESDMKRFGKELYTQTGESGIGFETFFESMFELCDTWCDTIEEEEYVNLVMQMQTAHVEYKSQKERKAPRSFQNLWKKSIGHVRIALRWQAAMSKYNKEVSLVLQSPKKNKGSNFPRTNAELLNHLDQELKQILLKLLADYTPEQQQSLLSMLLGLDDDARRLLLQVLANCNEEQQGLLLEAVKGLDADARTSLLKLLAGSTAEEQQALLSMLTDLDGDARLQLLQVLANYNKEQQQALLSMLTDLDGKARRQLLQVLANCNEEQQGLLLEALKGLDADARTSLLKLLAGSTPEEQQALLSMLLGLDDDARRLLLQVLANCNKEQQGLLLEALKNLDAGARTSLLKLLAGSTAEEQQALLRILGGPCDNARTKKRNWDKLKKLAHLNMLRLKFTAPTSTSMSSNRHDDDAQNERIHLPQIGSRTKGRRPKNTQVEVEVGVQDVREFDYSSLSQKQRNKPRQQKQSSTKLTRAKDSRKRPANVQPAAPATPIATPVRILKLKFGDELHRIHVTDHTRFTFGELAANTDRCFETRDTPVIFEYDDDEGDACIITSDMELQEAFDIASRLERKSLKVCVRRSARDVLPAA
jgi:hypothetical protein